MKKVLCLVVLGIALAACASTGREIKPEQVAQLKKGETTLDQAVAILGKPTSRTMTSDGTTVLGYVYARAQARPETFIPIVGAFVGGADTYGTSVMLFFDKAGVLQQYTASETATGTGQGLASGTYRERVPDQPQEAK